MSRIEFLPHTSSGVGWTSPAKGSVASNRVHGGNQCNLAVDWQQSLRLEIIVNDSTEAECQVSDDMRRRNHLEHRGGQRWAQAHATQAQAWLAPSRRLSLQCLRDDSRRVAAFLSP